MGSPLLPISYVGLAATGAMLAFSFFDSSMLIFLLFIITMDLYDLLWVYEKVPVEEEDPELVKVSAVIAAKNEAKSIARCVNSVKGEVDEVIVVSDGSTDDTAEKARTHGARVVETEGIGKSRALNLGIELARNPFVLTIDADTVAEPGALLGMRRRMIDGVGAVTGTMGVLNPLKSFVSLLEMIDYMFINFSRFIQNKKGRVSIAPGMFTLYRKEALEKACLFEGDTLIEDYDMSVKLYEGGFRIVYAENSKANTVVPESFENFIRQRVRWFRGGIEVFKKHGFSHGHARNMMVSELSGNALPLLLFFLILTHRILSPNLPFIPTISSNVVLPVAVATVYVSILHALHAMFFSKSGIVEKVMVLSLVPLFVYGSVLTYIWLVSLTQEIFNFKKQW